MLLRRWMPVLLVLSASAAIARAHGIEATCDVHAPDQVKVTVLFGTAPGAGAAIRVLDPELNEIAAGTTDTAGRYAFTAPEAKAYVFEATIAGHRTRCQLTPDQVALLNPHHETTHGSSGSAAQPGIGAAGQTSPAASTDHDHAPGESGHVGDRAPGESEHVDEALGDHDHDEAPTARPASSHAHEGNEASAAAGPSDTMSEHGHSARSVPVMELVAGVALILAFAAFVMVCSLRHELQAHLRGHGGHGG